MAPRRNILDQEREPRGAGEEGAHLGVTSIEGADSAGRHSGMPVCAGAALKGRGWSLSAERSIRPEASGAGAAGTHSGKDLLLQPGRCSSPTLSRAVSAAHQPCACLQAEPDACWRRGDGWGSRPAPLERGAWGDPPGDRPRSRGSWDLPPEDPGLPRSRGLVDSESPPRRPPAGQWGSPPSRLAGLSKASRGPGEGARGSHSSSVRAAPHSAAGEPYAQAVTGDGMSGGLG